MKHLRKFEKYTTDRKRNEIIKESVLQVNDIYKVRTFVDIPQSLINAYVKKVKDSAGKNLRQIFGDVDMAEEIVKYIYTNFLNVDQIPTDALIGGKTETGTETQSEETQSEESTEVEETSTETTEEPKVEVKAEAEVETSSENTQDFEEVKEEEKEETSEETKEEEKEETSEETKEEGTEELPS